MITTPRDRTPLPDPDHDRDVYPFGPAHPTVAAPSPLSPPSLSPGSATHDRMLRATQHAEPGPNGLGSAPAPHDHLAEPTAGGWGHRLLMLVYCIPMLVVVFALVASGVAGAGSIIFALLCVGMMAAMMFMMPGGHRH